MRHTAKVKEIYQAATCLFSKAEVEKAMDKMAQEMTTVLQNKHPIFLCVLVGGIVPLGHLLTRLAFPLEVDYIHATRYKSGLVGQDLTWKAKPSRSIQDRAVVIVDDILDGGVTLGKLTQAVHEMGASEVYTAVLVDKHHEREMDGLKKADFVGLEVDDHYVFGFGMDYQEYLRNVPGIYKVSSQHMQESAHTETD